jgi:TonB family protein
MMMAASVKAEDHSRVLISRAPIAYPELAMKMKMSGVVRVRIRALPSGDVATAKFESGNPILAVEAENSARRWRFMPARTTDTFVVEVVFDLTTRS